MTSLNRSTFLRYALLIDAAASAMTGALLLFGAGALTDLLGLPVELMRAAGTILVPYVVLVAAVATRPSIPAPAVWLVIACNVIWTLASFAVVGSGMVAPTALGVAFVAGQALAVLTFAALQYVVLNRPQTSAA